MSTQDELKRSVAQAAIRFVKDDEIIGVGTGTTADYFIDQLGTSKPRIRGAVASSERTAKRLTQHRIRLFDLDEVESLFVYIDGADQIDAQFSMIKGGGGALTREKIVAAVAQMFVCIADESKRVETLGGFPLPVEVVPIARAYVMRELAQYGVPRVRSGFTTDNGNPIIDVHDPRIDNPQTLEQRIDGIAGVVTNGLFAIRGADVLLLGTSSGVIESRRPSDRSIRPWQPGH